MKPLGELGELGELKNSVRVWQFLSATLPLHV